MKLLKPNDTLAVIIGSEVRPHNQVVRKVWDYIKEQRLQDMSNRAIINADKDLQAVFEGQKQVSMFAVTKPINKHLNEPEK